MSAVCRVHKLRRLFHGVLLLWTEGKAAQPGDNDWIHVWNLLYQITIFKQSHFWTKHCINFLLFVCSKAKSFLSFVLRCRSFLPRASELQYIFIFILFILISLFLFVYLFRFQLSNGFYHCSLSSDPSVASVGAGPFPHFPPVSRAWTRAPSALLPDYAHYYTIGPGMLPSSKIPSWKVCVPFVVAVLTSSYQQCAHGGCCCLSIRVITCWFV